MMPPTPLSRCALYCALALAATPALADTVTLTELPAPDGYPVAGVSNIAADGTVIGTVFPDGLVVRWTPGAAPEVLGGGMTYTLENIMPLISKDASVIATAGYFGDDPLHAAPEIWQGGTDWAMVSGLTLGDSTPFGISWSGQVLSGAAYPADPPADGPSPVLPWIWTAAGGQVALALPADAFSGQAWAVSDDGSVAAGFAEPSPDDWTRYGMRWVDGAPQWILDADSQRVGQAIACNGDCSVIVGAGVGPNSPHAWRWTVDGGIEYLGTVPGAPDDSVYYAFESSWDGSVIVGSYAAIDPLLGPVNRGFLWTQARGMQDLVGYLAANGISYGDGWLDMVANAVTPDGQTLLINGMDGDYARRRATVHVEMTIDSVFGDGFDGFHPF